MKLTHEEISQVTQAVNSALNHHYTRTGEIVGSVIVDADGDLSFEGYFSLRAIQVAVGMLVEYWPVKSEE